ncbi:B3 domain-containing protein At5g18000-like [Tripterygium wilfordii]|uniref:B3 domain-containing protein At5g18000-like n=1 Tax=Tripterygium wilfordii TaxID=458696 RepID=UPI0018F81583|nr:B3 domain-containing protein At5g18000-like [Tripterygium wilfordii]
MKLGKKTRSKEKFPRFFKIYLQEHSCERMQIPSAFVARIDRNFPENVILRSSRGRIWLVKVIKVENDVFFEKGWKEFVKDNSIEHKDFLEFKYNGGSMFDFTLFGNSQCEKKEEEVEEEEEEDCDHDYDYDGEEEEEEDDKEDEDEEETKFSRKKRGQERIGAFKARVGVVGRTKQTTSSSPSTPVSVNLVDNSTPSGTFIDLDRPMEKKAEHVKQKKRKGKVQDDSPYDSIFDCKVEKLKMHARKMKIEEEKLMIAKQELQNRREVEEKRIMLEERQEEMKIMMMDGSSLSEEQKEYIQMLRAEIIAKKRNM